jgi:predicted dehydrogenase
MTYRAGVVGFGRVGRNHAEALLDAENVELGAVADVDEALVAELGDRWGVPESHRYHGHAEMLASEELDVVSIATPGGFHRDHVLDVVASATDPDSSGDVDAEDGPDVIWCEKPIATSVGDAEEMVAACDDAGIELVVNHSRRFAAAFEALREMLDDGLLGDLRSAHVVAGGELLNIGTHYVDLLCYLLDARVSDVRGGCVEPTESHGETRFEGGGTLVMEDGTVAHLNPVSGSGHHLHLEGTEGRLSIPLSIARDADTEWHYWSASDEESGQTMEDPSETLEAYWREDISGTHSTFEPGMVPAQTLFENGVKHVVDLLDGRAENGAPGTRATHGLEALTGLVVSEYTGSRVSLPLVRPFREMPLAIER